ncbi:MAG: hypothetical protein KKD74_02665 [Bacteroidetes bacterium]|nr:hypothetical protein [Bacteroidota bacterium]
MRKVSAFGQKKNRSNNKDRQQHVTFATNPNDMPKKYLVLVVCCLMAFHVTQAQRRVSDSTISSFLFHGSYALQIPSGDLTTYFGVNSTIGGGASYKSDRNWLTGFSVDFIFGDKVKNRAQLLSMITTKDGEIIDGDGIYTSLALFERGYQLRFHTGKIIPVLSPNPNSGILVLANIGYVSHHIRIESQYGTAPQIKGDYAKGYDKLRGGFSAGGEVGYFLMGNTRVLNFIATLQFLHGWTRSQRDYSFDLMAKDNKSYNDNYYGFRLTWMIPTYQRAPQQYYYY